MSSKDPRSVIDPSKFLNRKVRVKFSGGREVEGTLKGHDAVCNLVLDDTEEFLRGNSPPYTAVLGSVVRQGPIDPEDSTRLLETTRALGLIVARGSAIVLISPVEGVQRIENPFVGVDAQ
ncbi:u6 snRNA-associated Sm-like protein, putative [Eimeria maxima]|uniref:U6 snRNA-associated Sm-like protein, putative n=1 Tax=Eimeria maxima TaxID=5804 RepID=U6M707_EIMMA|nr:u6 snRNA-associated Sm-like protein, putative [Eimeria maxima]CDJ58843.1 u6 snRNA-associated Sm-like protein, putative [Eimeria maxima]